MKKCHSAEQIVVLFRRADVDLGKWLKVPEVCRKLGITRQTYYRWRTKYGGMEPKMAKQLQELHNEERPHSSLGYQTPSAFAAGCANSVRATPSLHSHRRNPVESTFTIQQPVLS